MVAHLFRAALRWLERGLFMTGVLCVVFVFMTWKHAAFFQVHARSELAAMAAERSTGIEARSGDRSVNVDDASLIGLLEIPRLDVSVAVIQGDDDAALRVGVGHLRETPMPWEDGNSALAGHRDTFFRPLRDARVGDEISLVTRHGDFGYVVRSVSLVGPDAVWVLGRSDAVSLTLITCYPFDYVGPAPLRWVVQAERVR
jgi:sortase A